MLKHAEVTPSGVATGSGAHAPGKRPWGRIKHTLFSHLKRVFKQKFRQNISKNAYFWKKNSCKIA